MLPQPDLRLQAEQINTFLQALYCGPRRVSDLLLASGLEAETIQKLKQAQMAPFYARLIFHWYEWAAAELSVRSAYILVRRFGLDGQPPARLAAIGQELEISRERARQLETKILQRLRSPRCLRLLEKLAVMAAREVLGQDQLQLVRPAADAADDFPVPARAVIPSGVLPDLETAILAVVREWPAKLHRSKIAKVLMGSPAVRVEQLRAHPLFGRYHEYQRKSITDVIERLIAAGRLELRDGRVAAVSMPDQAGGGSSI